MEISHKMNNKYILTFVYFMRLLFKNKNPYNFYILYKILKMYKMFISKR